jgi:hypothetical protein
VNHQCLFVYLCEKYSELNLNWNFFEELRTKRNGINYYGNSIDFNYFKSIEVQLNLYINLLIDKIKHKLITE